MLCRRCNQEKPLTLMVKSGSSKGCGYKHLCKECRNQARRQSYAESPDAVKAQNAKWREANRDVVLARHKAYREANRDHVSEIKKAWYEQNKSYCNAKSRANYEANKAALQEKNRLYRLLHADEMRAYFRQWRKLNAGKRSEYQATRRAAKACRTPPWVDRKALQEAYEFARYLREQMGQPFEVDHVIPLRGKTVSGLHVPWNLRVRPVDANRKKATKWDESEAFAKTERFEVSWS